MPLLSCLMYIAANVVLMILVWLYNRSRNRQVLLRHEQVGGNVDNVFSSSVTSGARKQVLNSSLLSTLGVQPGRTFYAFEDHFTSFEDVADACRRAGLERCQLILGVDFSASNEWQGRRTFNGNCLHKIVPGRKTLNPYQKVISIMCKTVKSIQSDNFIPVFGFGDKETNGEGIFPFTQDPRGCNGLDEVMEQYERVAATVTLGGPTSFAPLIHEAVKIVQHKKCYHILIIIADGQVSHCGPTAQAIVEASQVPLSIVVVGVGDGPWESMEHFDDQLPQRQFDNFQFVNFHKVTAAGRRGGKISAETLLALHVLMEIPDQYKTIRALGYLAKAQQQQQREQTQRADARRKLTTMEAPPPRAPSEEEEEGVSGGTKRPAPGGGGSPQNGSLANRRAQSCVPP